MSVAMTANRERICEEVKLDVMLLQLRSVVDYCFTVER
jgi:hypothetical protein